MVPATAKHAPINKDKIISDKRKSNRINYCRSIPALKSVCNTSLGEIEMTPVLKLTKLIANIKMIKNSTSFLNRCCLYCLSVITPLLLYYVLDKERKEHQSTM